MKYQLSVMMVVCLLSSLSYASKDRGGGDARCAEYSDLVGRIASALVTTGQEKVSKVNAVIKVDELWAVKQQLVCIPVQELDRQAVSYPATKETQLLVVEWEKLNITQKVRLAAHELAVLARYENDGEYFISDAIVSLFQIHSTYLRSALLAEKSEQVLFNNDGTVTFIEPYHVIKNVRASFGRRVVLKRPAGSLSNITKVRKVFRELAVGICRYLDFQDAVATEWTFKANPRGMHYIKFRWVDVTDDGHIGSLNSKLSTGDSVVKITSVTCSN